MKFVFWISIFCLSFSAHAQMKVYKSDGSTVVGTFTGCTLNGACGNLGTGWGYANTSTGAVSILSSSDAYSYAAFTIYYSLAGCVGQGYTDSGLGGPTCNGSACVSGISVAGFSVSWQSYDAGSGCVPSSSSGLKNYYATSVAVPTCGASGGCQLKP